MFVPLFLRLEGRAVLVVGGGEIAAHKAGELARSGARVTLVAPDSAALPPGVRWLRRCFLPEDVRDAWLVVAATDDPDVQAHVARCAEEQRTFVIAVDDLANASAISPAVVRRGPVTVAISSAGEAPALTRLLREIIEQILPEPTYVEAARALRRKWKLERVPMKSRFADLVATLHSMGE